MNLAFWLERAARRWPDQPALLRGEAIVCNYASFARRAASLAKWLQTELGFQIGDRAAIFAANSPDYIIWLYAIWYAGGVAVPINSKLHPMELAWILSNSGARVLLTDFADRPKLNEALAAHDVDVEIVALDGHTELELVSDRPASRAPGNLAWLFYTSGTTGRPKGVNLTHGMLTAMALGYLNDVDEVRPTDAALYAAPLSHGAGLYNLMHVHRGARHVVPASGGFDADELIDLIPRLQSVHMFAAPTMVIRLLAAARSAGWHGKGLRTLVYGGGPMYLPDIADVLDWFGDRFVQIYGQGECPMAITSLTRDVLSNRSDPRWAKRAASVGVAQSCVEVQVVDAAGKALPSGQIGEIVVRGTPAMQGYWQDPVATAGAIRDGWLYTGDLGALDDDGFLTLKDRSKDVIISGGSNIYPKEVEEVLLCHPSVMEAAVVGERDVHWGESVVAFVVSTPGHELSAQILDTFCLDYLARFKRPKKYFFVRELPKNGYGKVAKSELRDRLPENSSINPGDS